MTLEELRRAVEQKKLSFGVLAHWNFDGMSSQHVGVLRNLVRILFEKFLKKEPVQRLQLATIRDGRGKVDFILNPIENDAGLSDLEIRTYIALAEISVKLVNIRDMTPTETSLVISELVRFEVATEREIRQAMNWTLEEEFFSRENLSAQ